MAENISIRISERERQALEELAKETGRTLSDVTRQLLKEALREKSENTSLSELENRIGVIEKQTAEIVQLCRQALVFSEMVIRETLSAAQVQNIFSTFREKIKGGERNA